jgi:hypothetical protein
LLAGLGQIDLFNRTESRIEDRKPFQDRMKIAVTIVLLLVVLIVVMGKLHQTKSAEFKWNYDYLRDPPCTNIRTRSCVKGFNLFVGDPGSHPNPVFVPNRLDDKQQLISKGINTTVSFEHYGSVQFCVTSVGADSTGAGVESKPTCMSKFVLPLVTRVRRSGQ